MSSKLDDPIGLGFLLPEHVNALIDHAFVSTLVPKPVLEADEIEEMDRLMRGSMAGKYAVAVRYWKEVRPQLGEIRQMWGVVQRVDPVLAQVKIVNDEDFTWINFCDLVSVTK
ncbi:YolD-like family protein [Brevibacillus parabrevis]|uniref:YolD-like family protein n=1 Tax=Brevibacillus parabrevis TaxID=54914 RepID=UPI001C238780|nr:YolD-like family protein [Brevibacillus parabrevis]MBU8715375.1 YolD-like family protein [Brevibacillus parabrevis]